jgi:hypothetical protein
MEVQSQMVNRALFLLLLCLSLTIDSFAQSPTIINISKAFGSGIPGTPRVFWDSTSDSWVVVWRQKSTLKARIVNEDGTTSGSKTLAKGLSSAEQSFDLALDTHDDAAHLVAYEDSAGLQVRAVPLLQPGRKHLIEAGANGSMPRLVFDATGEGRYFIFWLGTKGGTRSALNVRITNEEGEPVASTSTLVSASPGDTFDSLNVAQRSDGSMTAILLERGSSSTGSILNVNILPDGTFQSVSTFQNPPPD